MVKKKISKKNADVNARGKLDKKLTVGEKKLLREVLREKSIERCEGRVQGLWAYTFSNKTLSSTSSSIFGLVSRS